MRSHILRPLCLTCMLGVLATSTWADDGRITFRPPDLESTDPGVLAQTAPCDVAVRYDDGTDDMINQGRTLGSDLRWSLGVVATPPSDMSWRIQSAFFYSEFVIRQGNILVQVRDETIPAILAVEQIFVDAPGFWEVEFTNPICVSGDFSIMLCPDLDFWGVSGEDTSNPDMRSYQILELCAPQGNPPIQDFDLMIWACVTPCESIAVKESTWGAVKRLYP